jgi:lipopolysaccharide/colanic/teichoic acid biosynthesis glycosyltransferase
MKRCFDIVFSWLAFAVFCVPFTIISVIILIKDGSPVFFLQDRVGYNKKSFLIYKFRTMKEQQITKTGKWLRLTGLDEIPQFINVLRGEMSIVGPRALTAEDIDRLGWNDDFHQMRWAVKPGITGLAQLYGGQHKKVSWFWDRQYMTHHDVGLDLAVVLLSFAMNIVGKIRVRRIIFHKENLK